MSALTRFFIWLKRLCFSFIEQAQTSSSQLTSVHVKQLYQVPHCTYKKTYLNALDNFQGIFTSSSSIVWWSASSTVTHLLWRRTNSWNTSFETLYDCQFTLSTQLIIPNDLVILFHGHSNAVSLETYPLSSTVTVTLGSIIHWAL